MKPRKTEITAKPHEIRPIKVVHFAATANPLLGEGKLIPWLILDTQHRPDVEELVRVHEHVPAGDVDCQWGRHSKDSRETVSLILMFKRPSQAVVILKFDIVEHGGMVDQIITQKAFYLQPGRPGDRLATSFEEPKILVEVPETGFREEWDVLLRKHMEKDFRRKGLTRKQARLAAHKTIDQWRTFGGFRFGSKDAE